MRAWIIVLSMLGAAGCRSEVDAACDDATLGKSVAFFTIKGTCSNPAGGQYSKVGPVDAIACCASSGQPDAGCGVDCSAPAFSDVQVFDIATDESPSDGRTEECCIDVFDGGVIAHSIYKD